MARTCSRSRVPAAVVLPAWSSMCGQACASSLGATPFQRLRDQVLPFMHLYLKISSPTVLQVHAAVGCLVGIMMDQETAHTAGMPVPWVAEELMHDVAPDGQCRLGPACLDNHEPLMPGGPLAPSACVSARRSIPPLPAPSNTPSFIVLFPPQRLCSTPPSPTLLSTYLLTHTCSLLHLPLSGLRLRRPPPLVLHRFPLNVLRRQLRRHCGRDRAAQAGSRWHGGGGARVLHGRGAGAGHPEV